MSHNTPDYMQEEEETVTNPGNYRIPPKWYNSSDESSIGANSSTLPITQNPDTPIELLEAGAKKRKRDVIEAEDDDDGESPDSEIAEPPRKKQDTKESPHYVIIRAQETESRDDQTQNDWLIKLEQAIIEPFLLQLAKERKEIALLVESANALEKVYEKATKLYETIDADCQEERVPYNGADENTRMTYLLAMNSVNQFVSEGRKKALQYRDDIGTAKNIIEAARRKTEQALHAVASSSRTKQSKK